ncbi:DNA cross-link repair 1A protein [Hondaea fermentalgiana]|uniref:DNA cross-link repair 1A protein n=1 Tax=Hondaea fermentalgiana TaxID=2315210 RepID=A0A2R5GSP4_9STRA|nr:DNA cross-link repair 1A protein [Hondaea fermentalgiana]|eukprot:GBG32778.1 DNA cross-link repair 1A protein [Hondaea fermentalgiana]
MPAAAPKVESFSKCDTIVVPDSDLEEVTPTLLKENIAPSMAANPRQFARIAKSTTLDSDDRDPDEECDEGDENFEALMDAVFDEDEEAKENAAAARENDDNGRNAFSMLMQGSKTQGIGGRRAVPASKNNKAQQQKKRPRGGKMWRGSTGPHKYPPPQNQVPDCKGFIVDGFRYRFPTQKNTFFLTHFHADHYGGIPYRWDEGPIYCTPTTARLLAMRFKVSAACIHQIKIGGPPVRVQGVDVIALDANHCPGAAMFLFKVRKTGRMHLHTGDLRYDRQRIDLRKTLRIPAGFRLSTIFLDTTYLRPSCRFISQQQAISQAAERLSRVLRVESRNALTSAMGLDGKDKSTLVVVGAYTIGKERFLWGLLRACFTEKEKIHVSPSKLRILKCLEDLQIDDLLRLTTDKSKARVHLTEMGKLNMPTLRGMLGNQFARVVALRPTGHAKRVHEAVSRDERVRIISVPYSEHSSFDELGHFIADAKAVTRGQALSFVPTVQSVGSKRGAGMADTRSELEALVRKV